MYDYNMWDSIIQGVLQKKAHENTILSKNGLSHPLNSGFRKAIGEPKGQLADYRLKLPDGKSVHVGDYSDMYSVHWDNIDPIVNALEHLRQDSPLYYLGVLTLMGVAIGSEVSKNKEDGGFLGGVGGFILGSMTLPKTPDNP